MINPLVLPNLLSYSPKVLESLTGKRILITGASGVIGLNLIKSLSDIENLEIHATSLNSDPSILFRKSKAKMTFTNQDLSVETFRPTEEAFDLIIFGSGYGQPKQFQSDPDRVVLINTLGLSHAMRVLNDNGRLLFLSTSEVYAGESNSDHSENDLAVVSTSHPRAPYIFGKLAGEALTGAKFMKSGNAFSARVALAYGPGFKKSDSRVLYELIAKALRDGEIRLQDNGDAERAYTFISTTLEMMLNILLFGTKPVYNVGSDVTLSILEIAETIGEKLNVPVIPGLRSTNFAPSRVSISTALYNSEFGLPTQTPFPVGLDQCINWARSIWRG